MSDEVKELLISMISSPNTKDRKRKIIFWYDPKEEYLEYVNDLVFDDNTELIIFKDNSFNISLGCIFLLISYSNGKSFNFSLTYPTIFSTSKL